MSAPLDWPALLRLGLRGLGLRPAQFWALTPAELMLMAGIEGQGAGLTRAGLGALARAFPDAPRKKETDNGGT